MRESLAVLEKGVQQGGESGWLGGGGLVGRADASRVRSGRRLRSGKKGAREQAAWVGRGRKGGKSKIGTARRKSLEFL